MVRALARQIAPLVLSALLSGTSNGRVELQIPLTIPNDLNRQSQGAVSGAVVVWVNTNGTEVQDVFARSIAPLGPASNLSHSSVVDPEQAFAPDIDGNFVVW